MGNIRTSKPDTLKRDIFKSGKYIQHFKPDNVKNPFSKIYAKKKQDVIDYINGLEKTNSVLDIGGGMGRLSLVLADSEDRKVVLTDISRDMLKLALNNVNNGNKPDVINADAHYLPFRDGSFDIILGLDLFCHLSDPITALRRFYDLLKDHGVLILDSTNSNPLWAFFYPRYMGKNPLNWLRIIKFKGVLPGWESIVNHYSQKQFYFFLKKAGFNIIKNINYGPFVCPKWHLVIAKKIR